MIPTYISSAMKQGSNTFVCTLCATPMQTRAIESGMQPKVLQKLLGHASIKTTMDRYVHVTNDSMSKAVLQFEKVQQNQNGTVSAVQLPKTLEK